MLQRQGEDSQMTEEVSEEQLCNLLSFLLIYEDLHVTYYPFHLQNDKEESW